MDTLGIKDELKAELYALIEKAHSGQPPESDRKPEYVLDPNSLYTTVSKTSCVDPNTFDCYRIMLNKDKLLNEEFINVTFPSFGTLTFQVLIIMN